MASSLRRKAPWSMPVEGFGTIPLEDITEAPWDDVNNVVYRGDFFSGKYACRQMKKQGGGNIVVTVSGGALNAYPGFGPYNAGKAGVIGLIKSMAYDWSRHGIRVNGLAPTHGMSVNFAMPPDAEVTVVRGNRRASPRSGSSC